MKEVDLLYNDYIRVMTCMHEKLRQSYNQYVAKFLDDKQRKEYMIDFESQKLALPGEHTDFLKMFSPSQ